MQFGMQAGVRFRGRGLYLVFSPPYPQDIAADLLTLMFRADTLPSAEGEWALPVPCCLSDQPKPNARNTRIGQGVVRCSN